MSYQADLIKYTKIGEIYRRGFARLYLYSLGQQIVITSAQIDGTNYFSQSVSPPYLVKGYNEVFIYFPGMLNDLRIGDRRTVLLTTLDRSTVGIPAIVIS